MLGNSFLCSCWVDFSISRREELSVFFPKSCEVKFYSDYCIFIYFFLLGLGRFVIDRHCPVQYCAKEMHTKFGILRSLFSKIRSENSAKFRYEFSSKRSRIFVESNEISPLSWRNFASTEAKFRFAEISG